MKKKFCLNKTFLLISVIILLIIIMIFTFFFKSFKDVNNYKNEKMILNFESRVQKIQELNESVTNKFGWLQIQGTTIDVPILKVVETSNDYSHGWISSNSIGMKTRNVLIGHNVLNVSNSPMVNDELLTDFEDMMAFVYYDFAKDNMYMSFTSGGVDRIFVIYAIGFYDYDYDNAQGLNTRDEISDYIKMVRKNSVYNYDVDVNNEDNLLTVKTCTRYFGVDEKQQFVIDARELRSGEETIKYNVKKSKIYNEYKLKDSYKENNEI